MATTNVDRTIVSVETQHWRNIRIAAYACIALAIIQVLALP
jgi:hypothetical protein